MKAYIYSYKVISSKCKKKWKNIKKVPFVHDKLVDERDKLNRSVISCGCCIPPKEILIELEEKKIYTKS